MDGRLVAVEPRPCSFCMLACHVVCAVGAAADDLPCFAKVSFCLEPFLVELRLMPTLRDWRFLRGRWRRIQSGKRRRVLRRWPFVFVRVRSFRAFSFGFVRCRAFRSFLFVSLVFVRFVCFHAFRSCLFVFVRFRSLSFVVCFRSWFVRFRVVRSFPFVFIVFVGFVRFCLFRQCSRVLFVFARFRSWFVRFCLFSFVVRSWLFVFVCFHAFRLFEPETLRNEQTKTLRNLFS